MISSYLRFFPLLTAKRPKQSERGQKTAEGYMSGVGAANAYNVKPKFPY